MPTIVEKITMKADKHGSSQFHMERLSRPITELQRNSFEVVVIGSGYGGSIAASRMARAGKSVCLLERGREIHPGEYPKTKRHALKEMQVDTPESAPWFYDSTIRLSGSMTTSMSSSAAALVGRL